MVEAPAWRTRSKEREKEENFVNELEKWFSTDDAERFIEWFRRQNKYKMSDGTYEQELAFGCKKRCLERIRDEEYAKQLKDDPEFYEETLKDWVSTPWGRRIIEREFRTFNRLEA